MKSISNYINHFKQNFIAGGKFEKWSDWYFIFDELTFSTNNSTCSETHIRDGLDLKRIMFLVEVALVPVILFACYNIGFQVLQSSDFAHSNSWRLPILNLMNLELTASSFWSNLIVGFLYFAPIYLTSMLFGGLWELIFAVLRKRKMSEGIFVTGLIFTLLLPYNISLGYVALGITVATVFGKEIFGGTGRNIFNPALIGLVFLYYSYPHLFVQLQPNVINFTTEQAFWGFIPGTIGTTSVFAAMLGGLLLVVTGIGSWQIMLTAIMGTSFAASVFNMIGSSTNPLFLLSPEWHILSGGFMFSCVFLATDPVSATSTERGKYIYGFLIGIVGVTFRVFNPNSSQFWYLSILLMNAFAPLIDYAIVSLNIQRRIKRNKD